MNVSLGRRWLLRASGWLGVMAGLAGVASAAELLSVEAAVELALGGNRRLQQGALAVEVARERERQVRSYAYPQVSGGVLAGKLLAPIDVRFPAGALGTYAATGPLPGRATDVRIDPGLAITGNVQLVQPLTQQYKIAQRAEAAGRGRAATAPATSVGYDAEAEKVVQAVTDQILATMK